MRKNHAAEITSFRIPVDEQDILRKKLPQGLVPDDSHHLLARKVVRDFISGDLVYTSRHARNKSRIGAT